MSGHALGEWKVTSASFGEEGDGEVSYTLKMTNPVISMRVAHLIEAAPDLLEACKLAEGFLSSKGHSADDPLLRGAIRAAIAKAGSP